MQQYSVTSHFGRLEQRAFADELEKRWSAIEEVREVITRRVSDGTLTPLDGIKTIAVSAAAILGYQEFQPSQGAPPSLVEGLMQSASAFGREPVPA